MDIGRTRETILVEPIIDPVPRRRPEEPAPEEDHDAARDLPAPEREPVPA